MLGREEHAGIYQANYYRAIVPIDQEIIWNNLPEY